MAYKVATISLAGASFVPDLPTSALQPNEYTEGKNVESDVRGIRSVLGDIPSLPQLPAGYIPTFITSSIRSDGYYYIVAAYKVASPQNLGKWFAYRASGLGSETFFNTWYDITPNNFKDSSNPNTLAGYSQDTNITTSWNGYTLFINDTINPPMYWLDPTVDNPGTNPTNSLAFYSRKYDVTIWGISRNGTTDNQWIAKSYLISSIIINGTILSVTNGDSLAVGMTITNYTAPTPTTTILPGTTIISQTDANNFVINKNYSQSIIANVKVDSFGINSLIPSSNRPYTAGESITITTLAPLVALLPIPLWAR